MEPDGLPLPLSEKKDEEYGTGLERNRRAEKGVYCNLSYG